MSGPQRVTAALYVDMGHQLKDLTWARPPRAKYECLDCGTCNGPVTGAETVRAFVATIRATHHTTHHQQGAQAA